MRVPDFEPNKFVKMYIDLTPALTNSIPKQTSYKLNIEYNTDIGIVGLAVAPTFKAHYPNNWSSYTVPNVAAIIQVRSLPYIHHLIFGSAPIWESI